VHVLHLRNASGYYGAERCIVSWVRELTARGMRFDVAAYVHPDPSTQEFLDAARAAGATVHGLPRPQAHGVAAAIRLVQVVRSRGIDVIHAHETRSHGVGWLVGGITATPVVGTVHGYVPGSARMRRMNALNRWFLGGRRMAALTVPTRALARELPDAQVVPNAAPTALADTPLAADTPPEVPTFGVVARLSPEKGVDVFLDAVAALPSEWRFVLVGDGAEADALARHPAWGRIRFDGYRPDATALMRGFTALVVPSHTEGLPLTLLEAMAQGVPVVATSVGGIPDAITAGEEGWLVPPGDPTSLAEALREVAADADEARRRAGVARRRFTERYTLSRVGDDLSAIYESVARRRR
jgi:glycosyltransferase involved in cell wall biosynthesis